MIDYLSDTNILSRIFKGDLEVRKFVEKLECAIDATIYIECLQGSKSNQEKRIIEKYLMRFPLLPITPESCVRAIDLIRSYSNSHGLLLADALIAATALENDLTLVTYNADDFKFINNLKWLKPSF
ncbi:MAG: PIN domain-containing protein [Acidobacteriota bacterium]|jgi:predicted nucleic acid-binding protein|nr:PIN domain-containing protein [Acidobacteriota bacterium]